ncbi:hypothetical protein Maq22A_c28795 [Methylobacterium aquaticum]|uniref:Uncharacterized protein n=1 Tax=Methylobacterium aquaticum TaxID=270351 RepID=A0A1Y0ZGY3_9HYPH|nr:hypothetical protein Maq22A_c28795 [Methylobacterium aquaticum]
MTVPALRRIRSATVGSIPARRWTAVPRPAERKPAMHRPSLDLRREDPAASRPTRAGFLEFAGD